MSLIPQVFAAQDVTNLGFDNAPKGFKIEDINRLISNLISVAFIVAGLLAFVFLIWGGIDWLISGGDKTKTEAARNRITAALVGLAIVAASWAIIKVVGYFFGVDVLGGTMAIPKPYN